MNPKPLAAHLGAFLLIFSVQVVGQAGLPFGPTVRISLTSSSAQAIQPSGGYGHLGMAMSGSGRWIVFESFAGLVPGDQNGAADIYRHDRVHGTLELVSVGLSGGAGNGHSFDPTVSEDGSVVAFASEATDLILGDTNGKLDIFVRDMNASMTTRVSVSSLGAESNWGSFAPVLSDNGNVVAFASTANNLVGNDTNQVEDVFVHDRTLGVTERVSVNSGGVEGNDFSGQNGLYCFGYAQDRGYALSADGRWCVFQSRATNLAPLIPSPGSPNGVGPVQIYLRDRMTGTTELISRNAQGHAARFEAYYPEISGDGRFVFFECETDNLGSMYSVRQVYVRDLVSQSLSTAASDNLGRPAIPFCGYAISRDGRFVTWSSPISVVPVQASNVIRVFSYDRAHGIVLPVSLASDSSEPAGGRSYSGAISTDGRWVVYSSHATNLVAGDTNGVLDTFLTDLGPAEQLGCGLGGTLGPPFMLVTGEPGIGLTSQLTLRWGSASTSGLLSVATASQPHSFAGGTIKAWPPAVLIPLMTDAQGSFVFPVSWGGGQPLDLFVQAALVDPSAPQGLAFSHAIKIRTP